MPLLNWARRWPLPAAGLFLLLLLFIEFPGVLLFRQVPFVSEMAAGSDLMDFNYPVRHLLSQGLRQGAVPLWTDCANGGFPIHAEGQGGFLYPPNLLLGLLPLAASVNLSLVLAYLGDGLLMFLYAREMGQSRTAALFAGMVLAFSGFFFGHIRHLNLIASAQWLPLLLLLCERYARTRRPAYLLALAPVQALQHLAGHPQITYYSTLFAFAYLVARVATVEGGGVAGWWGGGVAGRSGGSDGSDEPGVPVHPFMGRALAVGRAALGFVLAVGLGAGLAAAQLLPTWELTQLTHRPAKGSLDLATYYMLPFPHLVTLVAPFFFGDPGRDSYRFLWGDYGVLFWENCGYVGLVPLLLALYALRSRLRDRRVALLGAAVVVSLLLAMGKQTPLFPFLWKHFPGMDSFRVAARFLLVTDVALAALAGFGLDALRRALGPRAAPAILTLCFLLAAGELLYYDSRQYGLVDAAKWFGPAPVMAEIAADRERYRVYTWHETIPWLDTVSRSGGWQRDPDVLYPLRNTLLPNSSVLQGMAHFSVYSGFVFVDKGMIEGHLSRLLKVERPGTTRTALRLLGLYNVGYVATPDDLAPGGAHLAREYPVPGSPGHPIRLFRNPYALPRAYLARSAETVGDMREFMHRFVSRGYDPRERVLLDRKDAAEAPVTGRPGRPGEPAGEVRWLPGDPGHVALQVDAPSDRWLVLSDANYPGWKARLDGELAPYYRANLIARALRVPAGRHQVTFTYEPLSWEQGVALSALSLALLLAAAFVLLRARGGKPSADRAVRAALPGGA